MDIKKAVEAIYNVNVRSVRIINIHPKRRNLRRIEGFKKGYKKAVVTLGKGEKIEIMPH